MPLETSIRVYLDGKWPTSVAEWLRIGGRTRYMKAKMDEIVRNQLPLAILRNERMAAAMTRLMKENRAAIQ